MPPNRRPACRVCPADNRLELEAAILTLVQAGVPWADLLQHVEGCGLSRRAADFVILPASEWAAVEDLVHQLEARG